MWAHYVELSLVGGEPFQVVVSNIDEFQEVNDAVGQVGGDCVLQKLARRCVDLAGDELHVCRLGGDEFICWGQFQENQSIIRLYGQRVDCKRTFGWHHSRSTDRPSFLGQQKRQVV